MYASPATLFGTLPMFYFTDSAAVIKRAAEAARRPDLFPPGAAPPDRARALAKFWLDRSGPAPKEIADGAMAALRACQITAGRRNPVAQALAVAMFKQRVVKPRRGRGSYSRKGRGNA